MRMLTPLGVLLTVVGVTAQPIGAEYTVPAPKIQVFPKGFRVSIPDHPGINLFAFHGNINLPMAGLDAGQFSRDILKKRQGMWVFEDFSTRLKIGDVIYFWLFVIRNNLGFRYDNGEYIVKDIVPYTDVHQNGLPAQTTEKQTILTANRRIINEITQNLTSTVIYLTNEVRMLREENNILRDVLERDAKSSKTLKFQGNLPSFEDEKTTVKKLIEEKLRLFVNVVDAVRNDDKTVTFTVETLNDKLTIIRAAKEELNNSKIVLTY